MAKLYNLVKVLSATAGTGTLTLGAAVAGFLTPANAGVSDGDVVSYAIRDGGSSEIGTGTYTASGTTLTRSVTKSTNSNNPINCSGSQIIVLTARAEDIFNTASIATKSDQQAGTSTTLAVTPGHQQDHDGAAKAWVVFDSAPTILASYNVTSITKNGTGDFTITWTTPFASANYARVGTLQQSAISNGVVEISHGTPPAANTLRVLCDSLGGSLFDPDSVSVVCYGRQ